MTVCGAVRPLNPLRVSDQQAEARVANGVVKLFLGPPSVQRHRHTTDHQDGGEGDDPLREVAHGNAHPVALGNAVALDQGRAQGVGGLHDVVKAPPLVLVDEERGVVAPSTSEERAEVGRSVLEHPIVLAVDCLGDELEDLALASDLLECLFVAERHVATPPSADPATRHGPPGRAILGRSQDKGDGKLARNCICLSP